MPRPHRPALCLIAAALLSGCATAPAGLTAPPPSAIPELRVGHSLAPDDPVAGWKLAAALQGAGSPAEALQVADRTLERSPGHLPSLQLRGLVLEELGRPAEAVVAYERLLADPQAGALRAPVANRLALARRAALEDEARAALREEARLAATAPRPRTVAVFPFVYRGAEARHAPLGRALTHMLVTDLAATDRLSVLERLEVQLLADEIARSDRGVTDIETGVRGGRMLGAEQVVLGQVGGDAGRIDLNAGVVPAAVDSVPPVSVDLSDSVDRFFELEASLALSVFDALGIELTAAERERVARRSTESLEALLSFGLGLEAQDAGRFSEARQHFERAVALDPSFADAVTALDGVRPLEAAQLMTAPAFLEFGGWTMAPTLDDLWRSRRADFQAIETLLPSLEGRAPWAETLDGETLTPAAGRLVIILPRPGGGP